MTTITEVQKAEARVFYLASLDLLNGSGIPYMLGGGFAQGFYTGIQRDTKDLDIFCKASDYPKILKFFADQGYKTELTDVRWLAKIFKEDHFIDIIFDTVNNICRVDDTWFEHAPQSEIEGRPVKYIPAVELLWCKIYVQNRERFDGADVNHLLLKQGKHLDWKRLLDRMDQHWHLLFAHLIVFQFVYPSEFHEIIPQSIFEGLIERAHDQYALPPPVERVCRGPIIDQTQYMIDIKEWDYKVTTIKTV